jgi:hypothetical protein
MKSKKKMCSGCETEQYIWKSIGREKYCQRCAALLRTGETNQLKRTPLSPKSSKKAKEDNVYTLLRKDYLTQHPVCEARLPSCTGQATDIHHKKGRGKYYLITSTWMSACRTCHEWIETNPAEAQEMGFTITRLTDEI